MTDRWLVEISGLRLGPLERADIQRMLDSGELRLDDRVCGENSDVWQLAQELFEDDGDQLLCGSAPHTEATGGRQPIGIGNSPDHRWADAHSSPGREPEPQPASTAAMAVASEPMFYIQRDGDEVGPLPLSVMQEFADDALLNPETHVRSEDDAVWTTAEDYGFEFPVVETDRPESVAQESVSSRRDRLRGSAIWIVFAPFFFVLSGGQSLSSLSRRQMVVAVCVLLLVGAVGFHFERTWSQTALTGRITLDGEPLANVLILLTGAATGDSGQGVSSGSGRFRIVTLDGKLKPGEYQVTVRAVPTDGADENAPTVPEQYTLLGLSDVVIEVTETTSTCNIELTSKRRLKRARGYFGGAATGASVLE